MTPSSPNPALLATLLETALPANARGRPTPSPAVQGWLAQRLTDALAGCLSKRPGRVERFELVLAHTLAAGTGWSTDWRLRAAITWPPASGHAAVVSLRTVDRGCLPPGSVLEDLWCWVVACSAQLQLPAPTLTERVQFSDGAAEPSLDVIRHRVLRAAAVLERLPAKLEVRYGSRRESIECIREESPVASARASGFDGGPTAAKVSLVRLVARFARREGTRGDTRVVLWTDERSPDRVTLLRAHAHELDPQRALRERRHSTAA